VSEKCNFCSAYSGGAEFAGNGTCKERGRKIAGKGKFKERPHKLHPCEFARNGICKEWTLQEMHVPIA